MTTLLHPISKHPEKVTWLSGLAFFFIGPLYFLFRGMVAAFFAWTFLIIITVGFAWVVGWFMAPGTVRKHLLRQGYALAT